MPYRHDACQCGKCKACVRRKEAKRRTYLKAIGKPSMVLPHELKEARQRVNWLHDEFGMSWRAIAEEADCSEAAVHYLARGRGSNGEEMKTMSRRNYDRVMAVEPRIEGSAWLPVLGTRRRLQGLMYRGFSARFLAAELSIKNAANLLLRARPGGQPYVSHEFARRVEALTSKLGTADPLDFGSNRHRMSRTRNTVVRWGGVPLSAWDDIDDPDELPDMTGSCGTLAGALAHAREGLALCPRCQRFGEQAQAVSEAYSPGEGESARLAEHFGVSVPTARKWIIALTGQEVSKHIISEVHAGTQTGWCAAHEARVPLFKHRSSPGHPSPYVCAEQVREYRAKNGHQH